MECPYCDASVGKDDLFCGECGKRLAAAPKKAHRVAMPLIIGVVAVVIVGCVSLGVVMVGLGGCVSPLFSQPSPTPTLIPTLTPTATSRPVAAADSYEPDDSIAQARPITTDGTPQAHSLHVRGDRDYVSFVAEAGVGYGIETLNLGSDIDTIIYLYDSDENELAHDDDGAEERFASRVLWVAPSSGTYYVMIRDLGEDSAGPDATYDIRLVAGVVIETDQYEPDDTSAQAKPMDTDGTRHAHTFHTSTDVDYVYFTAQQGVEYTIETGNLQGGCDTIICLYDEDGEELDYDDDGGEGYASRIVWSAPSSDTYYVKIEEFGATAGPDVSYEIWVSRSESPD